MSRVCSARGRERLICRCSLQKETKNQSSATSAGGSDCQSPAESPGPAHHSSRPAHQSSRPAHHSSSSPAGSLPLNDKEVEDIIRFINGVDASNITSSPSTSKQKSKQKCRKVSLTTATQPPDPSDKRHCHVHVNCTALVKYSQPMNGVGVD